MVTTYTARFFCHGCGLENTFTFHANEDYFTAVTKASTLSCPSGCNPSRASFELTSLKEEEWETALEVANAVFH